MSWKSRRLATLVLAVWVPLIVAMRCFVWYFFCICCCVGVYAFLCEWVSRCTLPCYLNIFHLEHGKWDKHAVFLAGLVVAGRNIMFVVACTPASLLSRLAFGDVSTFVSAAPSLCWLRQCSVACHFLSWFDAGFSSRLVWGFCCCLLFSRLVPSCWWFGCVSQASSASFMRCVVV